jgi:hypothetical protein
MKDKMVVKFSSSTWPSVEFQLLYKQHFEARNWNIETIDVEIQIAAKI